MSRRSPITDVNRFMRSRTGRQFLNGIRGHLYGRTVLDARSIGRADGVATILRLDNGETYRFMDEELSLDTLHGQFSPLFKSRNAHPRKGARHATNEFRSERGN